MNVFDGIKVADFSWVAVGPLMGKLLADHGATVIKIESPSRPDALRSMPPFKDRIAGLDRSGFYFRYNNNKHGVSLNLNHPQGPEVAKKLVAWADIVLESYVPGVMSRWGLGYDDLVKVKPDIIMVSCSSQGQTGPHASQIGLGQQLASLSGFTQLTGWPDREPATLYGAYTDFVTPFFGMAALVAALDYRRRKGAGQHIDLGQYECGLQFLSPVVLDYLTNNREWDRAGNTHPNAAPHGAYRCEGNNRWCVIAVFNDEEWKSFCSAIDSPPWTAYSRFATSSSRKENEAELDRLVEQWTCHLPPEEVMRRLQANGVSAGIIENGEDLHNDPQLAHRQHFQVLCHPEMGAGSCELPAFELSKTPAVLQTSAPCIGKDNEYVYTKILGMADEEFVQMLTEGVFS